LGTDLKELKGKYQEDQNLIDTGMGSLLSLINNAIDNLKRAGDINFNS
jgi:hypothetical protein